jgi:hypothetical protein
MLIVIISRYSRVFQRYVHLTWLLMFRNSVANARDVDCCLAEIS